MAARLTDLLLELLNGLGLPVDAVPRGEGGSFSTGALTGGVSKPLASHVCARVQVSNPTGSPVAWAGYGTAVVGEGIEVPPAQSRTLAVVANSAELAVVSSGTQAIGYAIEPR